MSGSTRRQEVAVGLAALAIGLVGAAGIYLFPDGLRVPPWVAYGGVSAFAFAGASLLAGALGARRLQPVLGVLVIGGILVPALWVAVGPGARACDFTLGEYVCRGAFGLGALLCVAIAVFGLRHAIASREPADPSPPGKRG